MYFYFIRRFHWYVTQKCMVYSEVAKLKYVLSGSSSIFSCFFYFVLKILFYWLILLIFSLKKFIRHKSQQPSKNINERYKSRGISLSGTLFLITSRHQSIKGTFYKVLLWWVDGSLSCCRTLMCAGYSFPSRCPEVS